ncbi:hypothetical protein I3760_01G279800 [Carya illinoinensis]|nr:hypothetical protein I3760_01G279800 [Carya illinoinensis]
MEVKNLLKDKKFWLASFLIAWAAALQGHMMWLQRQDSFKQKFATCCCHCWLGISLLEEAVLIYKCLAE